MNDTDFTAADFFSLKEKRDLQEELRKFVLHRVSIRVESRSLNVCTCKTWDEYLGRDNFSATLWHNWD